MIDGTLWILGRGDPEVARDTMDALAKGIRKAGVTRSAAACGAHRVVRRATGRRRGGRRLPATRSRSRQRSRSMATSDPAAAHRRPRATRGRASPSCGPAASGSRDVPARDGPRATSSGCATVASAPVKDIVRRMNVDSLNFDAEVRQAAGAADEGPARDDRPGAAAIEAFERDRGVGASSTTTAPGCRTRTAFAPGDRAAPVGCRRGAWGPALRFALPRGGQGTLKDRLRHVRVRAKTGTLEAVSALSGWVWLEDRDAWGQFSIVPGAERRTRPSGSRTRSCARSARTRARVAALQVTNGLSCWEPRRAGWGRVRHEGKGGRGHCWWWPRARRYHPLRRRRPSGRCRHRRRAAAPSTVPSASGSVAPAEPQRLQLFADGRWIEQAAASPGRASPSNRPPSPSVWSGVSAADHGRRGGPDPSGACTEGSSPSRPARGGTIVRSRSARSGTERARRRPRTCTCSQRRGCGASRR